MHQAMLLNPSVVPSRFRGHLQIIFLLLGITVFHVWAGPALSTDRADLLEQGSSVSVVQQESDELISVLTLGASSSAAPPLAGVTVDHNDLLLDTCAAPCPDGHLVATVLCSMVLAVVGLMGLYCLRAVLVLKRAPLTRRSVPSLLVAAGGNAVSLLKLSISRI